MHPLSHGKKESADAVFLQNKLSRDIFFFKKKLFLQFESKKRQTSSYLLLPTIDKSKKKTKF